MKLYRVYNGDENRNKKIWQTENAKDISSIINMDSFFPIITFYLTLRQMILTHLPKRQQCLLGCLSKCKCMMGNFIWKTIFIIFKLELEYKLQRAGVFYNLQDSQCLQ